LVFSCTIAEVTALTFQPWSWKKSVKEYPNNHLKD
jgi:hypothetical protein